MTQCHNPMRYSLIVSDFDHDQYQILAILHPAFSICIHSSIRLPGVTTTSTLYDTLAQRQ